MADPDSTMDGEDAGAAAPATTPPPAAPSESRPGRRRRWLHRWPRARRLGRWSIALLAALLSAGLVSFVTIDLGPALRGQAERQFANYLDRPVRIGRLSTYLLPGRFLIEDLVIEGLSPGDRPFFRGERIVISTAWLPLLRGEFLVDDVDLRGWRMLVEGFGDGRHSFPPFARGRGDDGGDVPSAAEAPADRVAAQSEAPESPSARDARPRRFVTTVQRLRAHDGEFIYEDHAAPWSVAARSVDLTLAKGVAYGGRMSFRGGTVLIGDFEPMATDVEATYALDGGRVDLTRLDLRMTGFDARLTGRIDLLNWPESTYDVHESSIDLAVMNEVFFADDAFTVAGDAEFRGTWHVFDGGRDLTGRFSSAEPTLQGLSFPALAGELLWTSDRFAVTQARSGFYGGALDFSYGMAPLGAATPALASFDVRYDGVDLGGLLPELDVAGARPRGTASGRTRLEWPVADFADRRGDGHLSIAPPAGTPPLMSRAARPARGETLPYADAPFTLGDAPWRFPLGAEIEYRFDPEEVRVGPSWAATPLTSIAFEGRTAWGGDSHIPFHVFSAEWREADRVMAAIMTAFGRPTGDIDVAGYGEMQGVMRGAFLAPHIEARFDGDDIRAWNVDWGHGDGDVVVAGGFLDVAGGVFRRGRTALTVDGRFALGPPPGESDEVEINAHFGLTDVPAQHLRDAFRVEGYPIDGPLHGAIHLRGAYRRPYGSGTLRLGRGVAYGESFDRADAGLRFDGDGVWLDGFDVRKGDGQVTGAMYIRWNGTYSVNADGRGLALETAQVAERAGASVTGALDFTISGAGAFEAPRYALVGTITDLAISGAKVGQATGRLEVDRDTMQVEMEAASPSLAVSGSGRIRLAAESDAELHLRVTGTRLDPFVRALQPELAESIALVASGAVSVAGPLRDIGRLAVDIEAEQLELTLFDYRVGNDGPIRLSLAERMLRVERLRLQGDGTRLDLTGQVDLGDERVALGVEGDVNLEVLQAFVPDVRSSGETHVQASIGGSWRDPVLTGEARVTRGRIRHFSLPHALDAIEGRLVFDPDGVAVDEVTAQLGGGRMLFGGRVGLRGYEFGEFNISAQGTGMNLRYPAGIRSTADADLTLSGSAAAPTLGGTVFVRDAIGLDLFESGTSLMGLPLAAAEDAPAARAESLPLAFDLRILAPSTLRINDPNAQIVASAELTLSGTYDRPLLFGNADIERGQVFFEGNRYRVTRGNVSFSNPTAIQPAFDVEAETDIRVPGQTYRVTLGLSGSWGGAAAPELEFTSDPPLQQFEIIGLLLGDVRDPQQAEIRTLRAREASQQELLQAAGARLLTNPVSSGVGEVVERSFGVDTFEIVPSLADPTTSESILLVPTVRVLIGKRISDRAHVTFSRALSGANQDLIMILEYDATDRLSWVLSQNEDQTYALDFRVHHAF